MYYVKSIIKSEVVIFLLLRKIKKQNAFPYKFQKILKVPSFHCQKLWRDRTSWEPWEFSTKKNVFFIKFLTVVI